MDTTEIYFTSEEEVRKVFKQRKYELEKVQEDPEYGEVITDPIDPVYSNIPHSEYCEYDNDLEDEYLPPRNSQEPTKSKSGKTPKPRRKRDVEDIYDEDHYSIPDIKGCITKQAGRPNVTVDEQGPKTSSVEKQSKLSSHKYKITGFVVLLVLAGGFGGLAVTILTGKKSLAFYM